MTPTILQMELVERLRELFGESKFQNPNFDIYGENPSETDETVPLNIFCQDRPYKAMGDKTDNLPFIEVKVDSGEYSLSDNDPQTVVVILYIGIHNQSKDRTGSRDVMLVIEKIIEMINKNPGIAKGAVVNTKEKIKWALQNEEDFYPVYLGGVTFVCDIPVIRREDEYS